MTVSSYYTKLKELWEEYATAIPLPSCTCASFVEYAKSIQQQRLFQFLMGLNESYQPMRNQILLMSPLPTVNQVYSTISQEESQRLLTLSSSSSDCFAMATRGRGRFSRGQTRGGTTEECAYCHKRGHTKESCYHLIGFPPSYREVEDMVANIKKQVMLRLLLPPTRTLSSMIPLPLIEK